MIVRADTKGSKRFSTVAFLTCPALKHHEVLLSASVFILQIKMRGALAFMLRFLSSLSSF